MFNRFQTISNEFYLLDRHYDKYNHIDKILYNFVRNKSLGNNRENVQKN